MASSAVPTHAHVMPFGAALQRGGVQFRLWAPAAREAAVSWSRDGEAPRVARAEKSDDGFWQCVVPQAGVGTAYQWLIDGELRVPDPASRSNPEGPHGPSRVVDPRAFRWEASEAAWRGRPWAETVLYELHVGSFTPEGSFDAAARELPRLADLGITAIELMPVASFPGRFGWGYDGVLPFAPHAAYGSPNALKRFVERAHALGLMVFMDVVYNHFGPDGNYLGRYAPQFFSATHTSPWGAAINFDDAHSETVREFFIHNALYWIEEFRIDGLRLDAVHAIRDEGTPSFLETLSMRVREATAGRQVHLVVENERNESGLLAATPVAGRFDAQWNDDFHHALHVLLTGETRGYYRDYGDRPLALLARTLTDGFAFDTAERAEGGARIDPRPAPAQPLGAMVNFVNNHDQTGNRLFGERLGELARPGAAEVATLIALLGPSIPMLFFGEEVGAQTPFLYFADWQGELREAVRQGRQREFGHMAAADPRGRPVPDPCDEATFAAGRLDGSQARRARGQAWAALVELALAVRREWLVPRHGRLLQGQHSATLVGAAALQVRWRYEGGDELWMDANLAPEAVAAPELPEAAREQPLQSHTLLAHRWREGTDGRWPAMAARWRAVRHRPREDEPGDDPDDSSRAGSTRFA